MAALPQRREAQSMYRAEERVLLVASAGVKYADKLGSELAKQGAIVDKAQGAKDAFNCVLRSIELNSLHESIPETERTHDLGVFRAYLDRGGYRGALLDMHAGMEGIVSCVAEKGLPTVAIYYNGGPKRYDFPANVTALKRPFTLEELRETMSHSISFGSTLLMIGRRSENDPYVDSTPTFNILMRYFSMMRSENGAHLFYPRVDMSLFYPGNRFEFMMEATKDTLSHHNYLYRGIVIVEGREDADEVRDRIASGISSLRDRIGRSSLTERIQHPLVREKVAQCDRLASRAASALRAKEPETGSLVEEFYKWAPVYGIGRELPPVFIASPKRRLADTRQGIYRPDLDSLAAQGADVAAPESLEGLTAAQQARVIAGLCANAAEEALYQEAPKKQNGKHPLLGAVSDILRQNGGDKWIVMQLVLDTMHCVPYERGQVIGSTEKSELEQAFGKGLLKLVHTDIKNGAPSSCVVSTSRPSGAPVFSFAQAGRS